MKWPDAPRVPVSAPAAQLLVRAALLVAALSAGALGVLQPDVAHRLCVLSLSNGEAPTLLQPGSQVPSEGAVALSP